jgi:rhodanese-related sulfurtransferase
MASQIKPAAMPPEIPEISRDELHARLHDPTLRIVDVLPPSSYVDAHIPGAINLPLEDIRDRARNLLPNFNAEIAVYCGQFT